MFFISSEIFLHKCRNASINVKKESIATTLKSLKWHRKVHKLSLHTCVCWKLNQRWLRNIILTVRWSATSIRERIDTFSLTVFDSANTHTYHYTAKWIAAATRRKRLCSPSFSLRHAVCDIKIHFVSVEWSCWGVRRSELLCLHAMARRWVSSFMKDDEM